MVSSTRFVGDLREPFVGIGHDRITNTRYASGKIAHNLFFLGHLTLMAIDPLLVVYVSEAFVVLILRALTHTQEISISFNKERSSIRISTSVFVLD